MVPELRNIQRMIQSKIDYLAYLEADRVALGIAKPDAHAMLKDWLLPDPVWKFQRLLRRLEYFCNCRHDLVGRLYTYFLKYRFQHQSIRLGFSIPVNVFGPGLAIVHYGTIVVSAQARVGKNCRIHPGVNIGASGGRPEAPQIGDNVYIGPGAIVFGDIRIGNNVAIGANATVNRSFEDDGVLIAGTPARVIKEFDITTIVKHVAKFGT